MSDSAVNTTELRESLHEFLSAESDLALVRLEPAQRTQVLQELWGKIAALGWFGVAIPEGYGGLGLGFPHLALVYEELGQFLTPLPVMTTLVVSRSIATAGSEEQKQRWLPQLAAGEIRASLALPTSAVALPQLEGCSVSGVVADVLYADSVDELLMPVQDAGGQLHLALVRCADAGVEIHSKPAIDLSRTLAEVRLREVELAADRLLPLNPDIWTGMLDHLCVAIACDAVGGAERILADTVTYLCQRQQFGRPIGSFQALKHRMATWKIQLEGITALSRYSAELLEERDPTRSGLASAAKASATDTYLKLAGDAIQLHGGIGFTWEHECHLFLKRAALDAALFGGVAQHKDRAARFAFATAPVCTGHEPMRRFFSHSN
jgi:alkylation response protein AidB-like acyl-CoA dehydrogenase